MNCQRIDAILDAHAAEKLSAAERLEVEAHLDGCARCADAWLAAETLAADRPDGPRAGLYDQLAAAVADQPAPAAAAAGRGWRAVAGIAASVLVVAVIAAALITDDAADEPASGDPAVADGGSVLGPDPVSVAPPSVLAAPRDVVGEFVAGRDYERVRNPSPLAASSEEIIVCEFFMWQCIHCYNFEASFDAWEEMQPDYVTVERVPALFNGLARLHAQAFYAAEQLGVAASLQQAFYEEFHLRGNPLQSVDAIRQFFASNGIDGDAFDAAFNSRAVAASLVRAEELNAAYGVIATPSLGVNGRYLTHPGLAGSYDDMLEVIDALVTVEAGDRCNGGDTSRCPIE